MYRISILIIGSEIIKGTTVDINSSWICNYLSSLGYNVDQIQTIDDQADKIKDKVRQLQKTSDLLIVTGGLGPTKDDITKVTISNLLNLPIIYSDLASQIVKINYKRFEKKWDKLIGYNYIPKEFTPHNNPLGLAPILSYQTKSNILLLLPGVPREVCAVCPEILPQFLAKDKSYINETITIQTHGISEENIFFKLCPNLWEQLSSFGSVSCLPSLSGVKITITISKTSDKPKLLKLINNSKLQNYIWQIGEKSLEQYIIDLAISNKMTFSFAESCTGGLCAHLITNQSGSSSAFNGSAITYSNESKIKILGVSNETIEMFGAVSKEVATQMAEGSLEKFNTDFAVSFTGIAGPNGGTLEKPVGTVAIAIASKAIDKKSTFSELLSFKGDREALKYRFVYNGLHMLLEEISNLKHPLN